MAESKRRKLDTDDVRDAAGLIEDLPDPVSLGNAIGELCEIRELAESIAPYLPNMLDEFDGEDRRAAIELCKKLNVVVVE